MLSCGGDGALLEKVLIYVTALIIHVPMLSCTWLKENIFNVGYMKVNSFLVIFWYFIVHCAQECSIPIPRKSSKSVKMP